jgi:hypothetical protein
MAPPGGRSVRNPVAVRSQSPAGTKTTFATIRNVKMNASIVHEAYSSMRSTVPPKSSSSAVTAITPTASHCTMAASAGSLPGSRPAPMLKMVAALVRASAGQPSWTIVSPM